jgi:hypothetical protein
MRVSLWLVLAFAMLVFAGAASAQLGDSSFDQLDHPAIEYSIRPARDVVAGLNRRIQAGEVQLSFDANHGYLPSLLKVLEIPIESQLAVFSKTSIQLNLIHPRNPRTIYFTDSVAVGWTRGGFVVELAAQDPEQGTMFYELDQHQAEKPVLRQTKACLRCHHSYFTSGVPGLLVRSTPTAADGTAMPWPNFATDHRSPFDQRWAGWYVTGKTRGLAHMGNVFATTTAPRGNQSANSSDPADIDTLTRKFDTAAYLSPYSDVVALMVLEHQAHLTNLLTRLGWETRAVAYEQQTGGSLLRRPVAARARFSTEDAVREAVDYLLFVDEALLPGKIEGTSGFAEQFAKRGPFDHQGRSLRQLDLERRLMLYPCSYMIYSPAFDGLPAQARDAIYRRMWQILGGEEQAEKYARLSASDRLAIVQILRETKPGLPDYFRP